MNSIPIFPLNDLDVLEHENEENDSSVRDIRQGHTKITISEAIKNFSSANPKKWVDECREALKNTYNIDIGSSSLSTRKFREK